MFCPEIVAAKSDFKANGPGNGLGDSDVHMPPPQDGIGMGEDPSLENRDPRGAQVPIKAQESSRLYASPRGTASRIGILGRVDP